MRLRYSLVEGFGTWIFSVSFNFGFREKTFEKPLPATFPNRETIVLRSPDSGHDRPPRGPKSSEQKFSVLYSANECFLLLFFFFSHVQRALGEWLVLFLAVSVTGVF